MKLEKHSYKRFFSGKNPIQRKCVVCHMDYLGYKDLIENDTTGGLLQRLYSVYNDLLQQIKKSSTASEMFSVRTFSDNVLIACPIDTDDGETEFGLVIGLVSMFQREMAEHGYFFRGAIEIGDLHMSEDMIFGKALVDAYQLETTKARFPRIVIGPALKEQLRIWNAAYAPNENPAHRALLCFQDGLWFVNYLFNHYLDVEVARQDSITRHKFQIEAKIAREKRSEVREKYYWSAHYHNHFCQTHGLQPLVLGGKVLQFHALSFKP
ncbi:MAG: hypothetical protein P4L58_00705 [Candidatus Pacebacteria bacterium]|nr:hypothetical protein [Candidatus Paceibacterota bacterium]